MPECAEGGLGIQFINSSESLAGNYRARMQVAVLALPEDTMSLSLFFRILVEDTKSVDFTVLKAKNCATCTRALEYLTLPDS